MSIRKSAAERRQEAEYSRRRDEWHKEMRARGLKVLDATRYAELSDVVTLLALAGRRFQTPLFKDLIGNGSLQAQCYDLWKTARQELDKSVSMADFQNEESPPDDGKVIYMPKIKT